MSAADAILSRIARLHKERLRAYAVFDTNAAFQAAAAAHEPFALGAKRAADEHRACMQRRVDLGARLASLLGRAPPARAPSVAALIQFEIELTSVLGQSHAAKAAAERALAALALANIRGGPTFADLETAAAALRAAHSRNLQGLEDRRRGGGASIEQQPLGVAN